MTGTSPGGHSTSARTLIGGNGVRWFQGLGARNVAALPLIDRDSAERADVVAALGAARLIYLLGGFTHYLGQTLLSSASSHLLGLGLKLVVDDDSFGLKIASPMMNRAYRPTSANAGMKAPL